MRKQLQCLLDKRVQQYVSDSEDFNYTCKKIETKRESLSSRMGEIIKVKAKGNIDHSKKDKEDREQVLYRVHFQYLIGQKGHLYIEEEIELRQADFYKGILVKDQEINPLQAEEFNPILQPVEDSDNRKERVAFSYDRLKAVQYAERWWNDYNPAYKKFDVDCTNFISQCLHVGGAPMREYPNRGKGWWMRNNNWSYSWSIANSLRLYLSGSTIGLRAKQVDSPDQLLLGDVICYDFEGDGRFNHNTIVTGKDVFGMPLVNAHTFNSRMRYWAYEDSTAYTPNIKYKFFTIVDDD